MTGHFAMVRQLEKHYPTNHPTPLPNLSHDSLLQSEARYDGSMTERDV